MSPGADAAAEPRESRTRADEAWHEVFELRELDLQLAFTRTRATGEDVEDQLRAIDHLPVERALEANSTPG